MHILTWPQEITNQKIDVCPCTTKDLNGQKQGLDHASINAGKKQ